MHRKWDRTIFVSTSSPIFADFAGNGGAVAAGWSVSQERR
jgi:hypothetical protein